ncbi:type 1 fimbrial protein [Cronobacter sakazakii]|nr:type 1 fimbrial protein [Cronobacter sakazakii]
MRTPSKIAALLLMVGISSTVQANSIITMQGTVVPSACTVDTDTADKQVDLGSFYRSQLINAGQGGDWHDFSLLLKQCPEGTHSATVTFNGTPDSDDATAFKNSGEANSVALRLASADHYTTYSNGSTMEALIDDSTRTATFPLAARIFTPKGNAGSGSFNSVINVDFTYE